MSALKWLSEGGVEEEYEAERVQKHDARELNTMRGLSGVMPSAAVGGRLS